MMQLFHKVSERCSRVTAEAYSTSFSSAIRLLHPGLRQPIFNIYGFVRFADEIVDSFQGFDKVALLAAFKQETFDAINRRLSLNPVLNSFQRTVHAYAIDPKLITAFFGSMEMDLSKKAYDCDDYLQYIYGSAEVVGLMCLKVFCEGDHDQYKRLAPAARSLGAAFQKVNFLRDIKSDYAGLHRVYFPGCDFANFTEKQKQAIEDDIQRDFSQAYAGILQLPVKARFGVYVAYKYYLSLFRKIKRVKSSRIMEERIRIPNYRKAMIVMRAGLRSQLNLM